MRRYKARIGAKFNNKEAQVIGKTINRLRDANGHVTAGRIVESAKTRKSPIHKYFEWKDSRAGEQYRLQQARDLINHIVEVVIIEGEKVDQRSFFAVSTPTEGRVYVTVEDAVENESYRKQLLNQAISTLQNLTITLKMFKKHI